MEEIMQRSKRVTHALTRSHSFEAGIMDMFKNIFRKGNVKFDPENQSEDKFKDLMDDTFLKEKWREQNCKEMIELDNHEFPFLAMVEAKDEFVTSEELTSAVENYNSKFRELYSNYLSVLKWGHDTFEKVNSEIQKLDSTNKDFKEGRVLETDLSDELHDEGIALIEKAIKQYGPESEKKQKSLAGESVKFSKYLEVKKSKEDLIGKSTSYKIELSEIVKFLKDFKSMTIDDENSLFDENSLPPYHTEQCTLFIFELARVEFSDVIFSSHAWQGYYSPGYPDKYFNIKTLADVLKQFIDK